MFHVSFCGTLFAGESRIPRVNSAVKGWPSAPLPYVAEPFWPEIMFQKGCDIAHFPEKKIIIVTEHGGEIWVLPDDLETANPENRLFADITESHDPLLIAPGEPQRSVLYYRSATSGIGHMPMIGTKTVDPMGAAVLHQWIESMKEVVPFEPGVEPVETALRAAHFSRVGEVKEKEAGALIEAGKLSVNPMIGALFDGLLKKAYS